MKLTKADKEYLKDIGYAIRDFEQIEKATEKTTYTMVDENTGKRTKINTEKAIEILGREAYLSGISRSAFHWSCVRETDKIGVLIYFDSSRTVENYFQNVIKKSWTWEKLTEEEQKRFIDMRVFDKIKGNDKTRIEWFNSIYHAFLVGLNYKPIGWREETEIQF